MIDYLLNALVTLFVTIDPIGLAPMFMVVTAGFGPAARRQTAIRAAVTAAAILIAFALVGERLIALLGISLAAFRIAGGLLLFAIAFEMVFERRTERKAAQVETADRVEDRNHVAIFPLPSRSPQAPAPSRRPSCSLRRRRESAPLSGSSSSSS